MKGILGQIKSAKELGRKGSYQYVWMQCVQCGSERWVTLDNTKNNGSQICQQCQQKVATERSKSTNLKSGRIIQDGYMTVLIKPNDFFYPMRFKSKSYVLEHRLVIAKHLGRCLQPWEIVHHKNGDRLDNRIENLELTTSRTHHKDHCRGYKDGFQKGYKDGKDKRIKELEQKIKELEAQ